MVDCNPTFRPGTRFSGPAVISDPQVYVLHLVLHRLSSLAAGSLSSLLPLPSCPAFINDVPFLCSLQGVQLLSHDNAQSLQLQCPPAHAQEPAASCVPRVWRELSLCQLRVSPEGSVPPFLPEDRLQVGGRFFFFFHLHSSSQPNPRRTWVTVSGIYFF